MTESSYHDREQTELKHYAIRLYLEAATRIIGSHWHLKFVDCCAGPWESTAPEYQDTSFGIALDVLKRAADELLKRGKAPRMDCLLIEKRAAPFSKLKMFAEQQNSPRIRVQAENWDFVERVTDVVKYCSSKNTFPFILIDPWGWKLAGISQIAPLLKLEPGEVVINLMSSFIARFVMDKATDLTDLLGEDFPEFRKLDGSDLEFAIVRRYCELIKREGNFKYVCALPVMKADSDAFHFHLIYATRHSKGIKVFKDVERRTELKTHVVRAALQQEDRQLRSKNLELFEAPILYREQRYQRLAAENRERAFLSVRELLRRTYQVNYDDCWVEALQFPAVYESDIRDWISDWEQSGQVTVSGRKFTKEVLKIEHGHVIEWRATL